MNEQEQRSWLGWLFGTAVAGALGRAVVRSGQAGDVLGGIAAVAGAALVLVIAWKVALWALGTVVGTVSRAWKVEGHASTEPNERGRKGGSSSVDDVQARLELWKRTGSSGDPGLDAFLESRRRRSESKSSARRIERAESQKELHDLIATLEKDKRQ
jgi:hypothetical protein